MIERDYPKVRAGQEAMVSTDAYPEKAFTGHVIRIAPLLRESSRQARLDIEIPNAARELRTGMFIRAQIEFSQHNDATLVPVAAIIKRGDVQGVFLADVEARKARFVPLTFGIISAQQAEVVAPALSGQVVVVGQHLLEDGASISIADDAKKVAPAEGAGRPASGETPPKRAGGGI